MEPIKRFILRHFERILVVVILLAAFVGTFYIEERSVVLNFYYLPVLVAGYLLGRRSALLSAVFAILAVILFAVLSPERFAGGSSLFHGVALIASWGGFLILASITVGTLYELNERRLKDLKNAYIGVLEILSKYLESTDRYTKGHSVRVSELAMDISTAMGLPQSEVDNVRVAALLHDIGKIEISGALLTKAAELSSEERELVMTHSEKGANPGLRGHRAQGGSTHCLRTSQVFHED